ncbi:MAG: hypothetical protein ACI4JY_06585 [Oscillospiraceae bacterium]
MDNIQTVTYQCPNCNAALEYDNASGKFRCFYCDSIFTDEEIKNIFAQNEQMSLDNDEPELTEEQKQDEEFSGQSALYTCPNCGAGVICDSLTASTRCHFCHTPVILSGRLSGEYKPDMIIPFYTTREQAEENFKKYMKGKFLLPKDFNTQATINNIDALYVPYWLKSGLCDVNMTAIGKIIRTWRSGDRRYTHTKVFNVERDVEMAFVRVPCDGSRRIDDQLMESIEPFTYSGLKPFSMSYLSGCKAEKYDVPKTDAAVRIDERIVKAAEEEIRKTAAGNYNALEGVQTNVRYLNQQYVYALLPVWFLNYTYKGKDYAFVMNGQTGAMFGELPVSKLKAFLFGSAVLLGQWLVCLLLGGACGGIMG